MTATMRPAATVEPYRPVVGAACRAPAAASSAVQEVRCRRTSSRSGDRAAGARPSSRLRLRRQRDHDRPGDRRADDDRPARPLVPALQRRDPGAQRVARLRGDPRGAQHRRRQHGCLGRTPPTSRRTSGSSTRTGSGRCSPTTPSASAMAAYGGTSYPTMVLVDGNGVVFRRLSGEVPIDELDRARRRARRLVGDADDG